MKKYFPCLFIALALMQCKTDRSPLTPYWDRVRAAADLSNLAISNIDESFIFERKSGPYTNEILLDNKAYYGVYFKYSWKKPPERFLNVTELITPNHETALQYINDRWETSSIYIGQPLPQDKPPVVGHVSYWNGRTFIRDNIVVDCHLNADLNPYLPEIARLIDNVLLKSPTYTSVSAAKPIVQRFQIEKSTVKLWSSTKLFIQVKNPIGGNVHYDWRFMPGVGGIWRETDGSYYFQLYLDNPTTILVRLIAFNDAGFSDWAEIKVIATQ